MKRQLLFFSLILIVFYGCKKDEIQKVKDVSLTVKVEYGAEGNYEGLPKAGLPVKISNLLNGQENTANTNAEGIATFESIVPGNYNISVAKNFTAEEFFEATGVPVPSNVAYNATVTQQINESTNQTLTLQAGRIGDLVFKQIYYAGSNTSKGASFRDQFIEIYNNSNETIYLDSLYIGSTLGSNTTIANGGQPYDWSTAEGMPNNIGDANKDYLYYRFLFRIPGSGKEHPLEPGKSLIIAQTGINHSVPYIDNNGNEQGITDPTLTVDLSNADFETYMVEYKRAEYTGTGTFSPYRWDIDNPLVPNVDVIYVNSGNDWVMDALGREDFVIFRTSTLPSTWNKYPAPGSTTGTSIGLQVPSAGVIDAVEIIRTVETQRTPKRLPVGLDAAGNFVIGGQYSSQSLIRKTLKTIDGRKILQDSNNSENDFVTKEMADPSKSEGSFNP